MRDIADLTSRLATGILDSETLVDQCLQRISEEDTQLHAFSAVFADEARAAARHLDAERAAGHLRGHLHGIPLAVKELADMEGRLTRFGSLAYAKEPAPATAPFLDRLTAAGGIVLGTTHMVEFAMGSWGTNQARGTPWNPADRQTHRVPGGSSSGSAVAVAAGLVPVAIGSDTGGSIRIPAALCGVVGYKPSYGLVPLTGVAPFGPTFDTIGPITRCVADAVILGRVLAGRDDVTVPPTVTKPVVGAISDTALEPIEPFILAAFHACITRLRDSGYAVERVSLPLSLAEYQRKSGEIVAFEAYRHLRDLVEDPTAPLDASVRSRVMTGKRISPAQYDELLSERADAIDMFRKSFDGVDLLVLPSTPFRAIPVAEVDEAVIPMSRLTRVANYLDLCAISLPVTQTDSPLPIGVQLMANNGQDDRLLATAGELEAAMRLRV